MKDNNAAKQVAGPQIETGFDFALEKSDMSAIKGDETNSIEKCSLKGLADMSDKPLVDSKKQVVKGSGSKK